MIGNDILLPRKTKSLSMNMMPDVCLVIGTIVNVGYYIHGC